MNPWIALTLLSAAVGALCGALARPDRARLLGAAIPWACVVAYMAYLSRSAGAQLWIIGVLTGGTYAAVVGALAAGVVRSSRVRHRAAHDPRFGSRR